MEEIEDDFPISKYTVQLYYAPVKQNPIVDEENTHPEQIASGVLIQYFTKYFLVTCKHVFDNIKQEDVIIWLSAGFAVRLPNEVEFINDDKDSIDLALIEMKAERLEALKSQYSFLATEYIGLDHQFDEELYYMLYGYINKKTLRDGFSFFADTFGFLTNIRRYSKIEKLGFSYENNITLEYNCRKQSNLYEDDEKRLFGPKDLKGLSGGGIWLSVEGKNPETYNYILVGIMIEERIDRGFVIGTKIALVEKSLVKP